MTDKCWFKVINFGFIVFVNFLISFLNAQKELWHYHKGTGPTTAHPSSKREVQTRRKGEIIHIRIVGLEVDSVLFA